VSDCAISIMNHPAWIAVAVAVAVAITVSVMGIIVVMIVRDTLKDKD
jgi:hypothetical protein